MFSRNGLPSRLSILFFVSLSVGIIVYWQQDNSSQHLAGQTIPPAVNNVIRELSAEGGKHNSIAIIANGNPIIAYRMEYQDHYVLKLLTCNDPNCSSHTNRTLDTGGVGGYSSIAIPADNRPVISYYDGENQDLKLFRCGNTNCSQSNDDTITVVDSTGRAGINSHVVIGADGKPIISYDGNRNGDSTWHPKVAKCGNADCTAALISYLDVENGVSAGSIAIGTNGNPVISFYTQANQDLILAICGNTSCSINTTLEINTAGFTGLYSSIAVPPDGNPIISFFHMDDYTSGEGALMVAKCYSADCSGIISIQEVDSAANALIGYYTSIIISTDGLPVISYYDATGKNLKVAKCGNANCSLKTITTVDSAGDVGKFNSLTLDANGNPVISYARVISSTLSALKIAKCATPSCGQTSTTSTATSSQASSVASLVASSSASVLQCDKGSCDVQEYNGSCLSLGMLCAPGSTLKCAGICGTAKCSGTCCECVLASSSSVMSSTASSQGTMASTGVETMSSSAPSSQTSSINIADEAQFSSSGVPFVCPAAAPEPSTIQTLISNAVQAAGGLVIKAHEHNAFDCAASPSQSVLMLGSTILENCNRFWVYEYTGEENARQAAGISPTFNGKFFISAEEMNLQQGWANTVGASQAQKDFYSWLQTHNNLVTFLSGKMYYVMSEIDLNFSCGTGLRSN